MWALVRILSDVALQAELADTGTIPWMKGYTDKCGKHTMRIRIGIIERERERKKKKRRIVKTVETIPGCWLLRKRHPWHFKTTVNFFC